MHSKVRSPEYADIKEKTEKQANKKTEGDTTSSSSSSVGFFEGLKNLFGKNDAKIVEFKYESSVYQAMINPKYRKVAYHLDLRSAYYAGLGKEPPFTTFKQRDGKKNTHKQKKKHC